MQFNPVMIQFFEWYTAADGRHWVHFSAEVPRLLSMGISAAWLPPAYKGTRGAASEGYDVYDIYDLGEFDQKGTVRTKYGSKEEYVIAVREARAGGMQVYIDVVLNHMGGAEEKEKIRVRPVDETDRRIFAGPEIEIEAYTRFTFPGRGGRYSRFQWDHRCFTGIDHAVGREENAIYSIVNEYGDGWEPLSHEEKGNFDYLILNDIETRNPAVREELKRWIEWYYNTVPFDGVRLDAVKHINPAFFNEWLDHIRAKVNPELFVLGEFWLSDDLRVLLKYIEATQRRMTLFDAPLHHNFSEASKNRYTYDLRKIFSDTLVAADPELAVTFVDNHDTQPLQSLEEYTEQWFKPLAYALILLRKDGYPCVFYPDLYGCSYCGRNKTGDDCTIDIPKLDALPALLMARKYNAYGEQVDYFHDPQCIGWVRTGIQGKPSSGCAVVLNTGAATQQLEMSLGKIFAGKKFYDFLGNCPGHLPLDEEGKGRFSAAPGSVSVWIAVA